jgi:hypothetical protein
MRYCSDWAGRELATGSGESRKYFGANDTVRDCYDSQGAHVLQGRL